jgi:hypothetical protein
VGSSAPNWATKLGDSEEGVAKFGERFADGLAVGIAVEFAAKLDIEAEASTPACVGALDGTDLGVAAAAFAEALLET